MNGITTITTKGQVTIPAEVRQMLNINIGDKVSFNKIEPKERTIVIKIVSKNIVEELFGSLKTNVPYADMKTVRKKVGQKLGEKYKVKT